MYSQVLHKVNRKYGRSTLIRGTPWFVVFHEFTVLKVILSNFNRQKRVIIPGKHLKKLTGL